MNSKLRQATGSFLKDHLELTDINVEMFKRMWKRLTEEKYESLYSTYYITSDFTYDLSRWFRWRPDRVDIRDTLTSTTACSAGVKAGRTC